MEMPVAIIHDHHLREKGLLIYTEKKGVEV
jgi:hypothetical protein